jgi:hypothetical protein
MSHASTKSVPQSCHSQTPKQPESTDNYRTAFGLPSGFSHPQAVGPASLIPVVTREAPRLPSGASSVVGVWSEAQRMLASRVEQARGGILWTTVVPLAMRRRPLERSWNPGVWVAIPEPETARTVVVATDRLTYPLCPAGYRAVSIRP